MPTILQTAIAEARASQATDIVLTIAGDACQVRRGFGGDSQIIDSGWECEAADSAVRSILTAAEFEADQRPRYERWLADSLGMFRFSLASGEIRGLLTTTVGGYKVSMRLLPGPTAVSDLLKHVSADSKL